jgi:4a-hydroxytetrahydrobiopterin dehydratase
VNKCNAMTSWNTENNALVKSFQFTSFEEAMRFMHAAIPFICKTDHHPTWSNTYNQVHVSLNTHDAGNVVTEKDWVLAHYLDELFLEIN